MDNSDTRKASIQITDFATTPNIDSSVRWSKKSRKTIVKRTIFHFLKNEFCSVWDMLRWVIEWDKSWGRVKENSGNGNIQIKINVKNEGKDNGV